MQPPIYAIVDGEPYRVLGNAETLRTERFDPDLNDFVSDLGVLDRLREPDAGVELCTEARLHDYIDQLRATART